MIVTAKKVEGLSDKTKIGARAGIGATEGYAYEGAGGADAPPVPHSSAPAERVQPSVAHDAVVAMLDPVHTEIARNGRDRLVGLFDDPDSSLSELPVLLLPLLWNRDPHCGCLYGPGEPQGSLATNNADFATGGTSWITEGTVGEQKSYRITWTFDTTGLTQDQIDAMQGGRVSADMVWEIQTP